MLCHCLLTFYSPALTVTALVSVKPFSARAVNVPDPAATGDTLTLVFDTFVTVNTSSSLDEKSTSVVASAGVIVSVTVASVPTVALTVSGKAIAVAGLGCSVAKTTALAKGQIANVPH